jgi:hypothetical protein
VLAFFHIWDEVLPKMETFLKSDTRVSDFESARFLKRARFLKSARFLESARFLNQYWSFALGPKNVHQPWPLALNCGRSATELPNTGLSPGAGDLQNPRDSEYYET